MVDWSNLPEPLDGGNCCDCGRRKAVTKDGRFCRPCLKRRVNESNPIINSFSDERGRTARSSQVLGGSPETGEFEDD